MVSDFHVCFIFKLPEKYVSVLKCPPISLQFGTYFYERDSLFFFSCVWIDLVCFLFCETYSISGGEIETTSKSKCYFLYGIIGPFQYIFAKARVW